MSSQPSSLNSYQVVVKHLQGVTVKVGIEKVLDVSLSKSKVVVVP